MKEKLRFRETSKLEFVGTEEYQKYIQKDVPKYAKNEKIQRIEVPICDILLERFSFPIKLESLNTKLKEIIIKQTSTPIFEASVTQHIMEQQNKIPLTTLTQIQIPKEILKVADIRLFTHKINQFSPFLNTQIKNLQKSIHKIENITSLLDVNLNLESKLCPTEIHKLSTELKTINIEIGLEAFASSNKELQLPIFEEFINCNKRFPRSFSESFDSPLVILIGEDKKEWHIPIMYALKELFCEITDKYPRITFREPELLEEGVEEIVDSLDPHSLDQFTFEYKIEFLDARKMAITIDEFVRTVRGRLKSGFLQRFGILVIAVKPEDLEKARDALIKIKGLRVYVSRPDDNKYEVFCSKVLGLSSRTNFFDGLKKYERSLKNTTRRFSVFVKRWKEGTDKFQYPFKVAVFLYLLNELRAKRKKEINNFEELCKFVKEVTGEKIKIEEKITWGKQDTPPIIPDIIYSPNGKKIPIEIETLIGTFEPLKKIDETVEKYEDVPDVEKVWIVVRPVSALLHYEELKARENAYKSLYNKKVEIKVLTLLTSKKKFRWNLINIDEFIGKKNVK
jgi:hypothetical protein